MNNFNNKKEFCSGKTSYSSERFANEDIERIQKRSKRAVVPQRAYLCICGSWHLTSKKSHKQFLIDSLNSQILEHKTKIAALEKELSAIKIVPQEQRKELMRDIVLTEIKKQNKALAESNKKIRKDNQTLMARNLKLQEENERLNGNKN